MTAKELILESIWTDSIIHAEYSRELEAALIAMCDDSAESLDCLEFWGAETGSDWRIHLDRR